MGVIRWVGHAVEWILKGDPPQTSILLQPSRQEDPKPPAKTEVADESAETTITRTEGTPSKPPMTYVPFKKKPVIGILVEKKTDEGWKAWNGTMSVNSQGDSNSSGMIYRGVGWGKDQWISNSKPYEQAVEQYGGKAKLVWDDGRPPAELLKGIHALVIPGGRDVNPKFYEQAADHSQGLNLASEEFDGFEIAMVKEALQKGLPIRGICRGMQILNVASGGTLIQDISSHLKRSWPYNRLNHRNGLHGIAILPGSRVQEMLGTETLMVSSLHHQAVHAVAPGFMPVAVAADQIIEAIEKVGDPTVIGVQFHPEKASDGSIVKPRFFESLVNDARRYWERLEGPPPVPKKAAPATTEEAVADLLGRGYRFLSDESEAELTDPARILETARKSNIVVNIPETAGRASSWKITSYNTFEQTVMVEAGGFPDNGETRADLELVEVLLKQGVTFYPKEHADLRLRSTMSILFNLWGQTLSASREQYGRAVSVNRQDLEVWKSSPPPSRIEVASSGSNINPKLERYALGLEALNREGFTVKHAGRVLDKGELKHALAWRSSFSYGIEVFREGSKGAVLKLDSDQKFEELLYAASDQLDRLSQDTREALAVVRNLKHVGAKFYRRPFFRKKPITFDIEAVWQVKEGGMWPLIVEHPKQEGKPDEVDSIHRLRHLLTRYQEEWKPQEPAEKPADESEAKKGEEAGKAPPP